MYFVVLMSHSYGGSFKRKWSSEVGGGGLAWFDGDIVPCSFGYVVWLKKMFNLFDERRLTKCNPPLNMRCMSCHSKLHRGDRVAMTSNNHIHHEGCYYQYLRPAADVKGGAAAYKQPPHKKMEQSFVDKAATEAQKWTTKKKGEEHQAGEGVKWKYQSDTLNDPFRCRLKCMRCIGKTKEGTQCERKTCTTLPFCPMHLKKHAHLRVGQTKLKDENGARFQFAGLFACDPKKKKGEVVFEKNKWIVAYIGDKMTKTELDARYPQDNTAPYAVGRKTDVWDGGCTRGVANFANDARNDANNNAFFDWAGRGRTMVLVATKDIKNGDEILADYGKAYWDDEPLPFHTAPTKVHRKRHQKCGGKSGL